jgi:hypothetical protein
VTVKIATFAVIVTSVFPFVTPGASPSATTTNPGAQGVQIDAAALVRQSVQNYERDWREAMSWSYRQTDLTRADAKSEVDVSEIVPLEGTPYERLIQKDGRQLSPEERKKEERKYDRIIKRRQQESSWARQERIRKYEAERSFVKDIPDAYEFRLVGEDVINERPAWVITMTPKEDFVPTTTHGNILKHIKGKLWLDKEELQWAKAEADVIDTIEIGWIMARIGPGTHFLVEQTRVADGLWLPQKIVITGVARVLLVHDKVLNEELTFSGYQKGNVEADSTQGGKPVPPSTRDSFR